MGNLCKLCGTVTTDGVCPNEHAFKKMCVNCAHSKEDNEQYFCHNEENMNNALQKVNEAIKNAGVDAYKVEVTLQPVALKKPTLKCGKWALSDEVLEEVKALFK